MGAVVAMGLEAGWNVGGEAATAGASTTVLLASEKERLGKSLFLRCKQSKLPATGGLSMSSKKSFSTISGDFGAVSRCN